MPESARANVARTAIFISYPREREADADRWQQGLAASGRSSFVCHRDADRIEPGFEAYPRTRQRRFLTGRIEAAEAVVILWDRNYGRAAWCAWELKCAAAQTGKRVFLANLDGTLVPRGLDAHVECVTSPAELLWRLTQDPPAPQVSLRSLDRVSLYPAASLLESRFAPRFDARTRGALEFATMIGWLVLSVGAQLVIYYGAGPWLTTDAHGTAIDLRVHLWALLAAINIAMTIVGAFTLSASAATRGGALGLGGALVALGLGIWWRGEPDQQTVTIAAAAMGTFHLSLVLLLRDRLLGAPVGGRASPERRRPPEGVGRAHAWSALGVAVVAVLLALGLRFLDEAIDLGARFQTLSPLEKLAAYRTLYDVPLRLGLLVGCLVGAALGTAAFRRVLGNYRATAPYRIPIAGAWAIAASAIATSLGYETGAWIQTHIVDAISSWGGSYAGAQVGVLLAAGLAVPIATGTGRLSIRHERWWGMIGAVAVIAIITLKIRSFPFAAHRDGVPREILIGSLCGWAPIALVRSLASIRGRILMTAIAMHVVVLAILSHDSHAPAVTPTREQQPRVVTIALAVPARPAKPMEAPDAPSVPRPPRASRSPQPHKLARSRPEPARDPSPTPPDAGSTSSADFDGPGSATGSDNATTDTGSARSGSFTGSDGSGSTPDSGSGSSSGSDGPGSSTPPAPTTIVCGGPPAMDPGQSHSCDLGGVHVVTDVGISVGCNDGETGTFTITLDGPSARSFDVTSSCAQPSHPIPEVSASRVSVRMNSGGGPDNHISFTCCGSKGLSITYH